MNRLTSIISVMAAMTAMVSCAARYDTLMQSTDVNEKYDAAFEYFNDGKYTKAAALFESIQLACNGTPRGDTVQFYHGMSYFEYGDLYTAEVNFESFIETYPVSPFTGLAKYLRLVCLYENTYRYELDQTPTNKAMSEILRYLYENPDSPYTEECELMLDDLQERLERKEFESAKLYYTTEDYKAAVYALSNVLKNNAGNRYREEIKYYTAVSAYKYADNSVKASQEARFIDYIDHYYDFIGEFPNSRYRRTLDIMFVKARHNIKGEYTVPEEYEDIDVAMTSQELKDRRRMDREIEKMATMDARKMARQRKEAERLKNIEKKKNGSKEIKEEN